MENATPNRCAWVDIQNEASRSDVHGTYVTNLLRPSCAQRCPVDFIGDARQSPDRATFVRTDHEYQTVYTRGTPIQIYVSISSSDDQALDLLSTPGAQDIRLVQTTSYCKTTYAVGLVGGLPGQPDLFKRDITSAIFWAADSRNGIQPGRRYLQGEVIVPLTMPPGCHILSFEIEVCT